MHPFMASEMGESFIFDEALKTGILPIIVGSKNKQDALRAYVGTYLQEEIKYEEIIRQVDTFSRFLETVSFSHGTTPNMTAIACECGVSAPTIKTYFEILSDLLLTFEVLVFSKRAKRMLVGKSKFYIFDVGVHKILRPKGIFDRPSEIDGLVMEGLVSQSLHSLCSYSTKEVKLFFWKTKSGVKVDFILYGEDMFAAIKVKHSSNVNDEYLLGLHAFATDYPETQLYLLYCGKETRKVGNVLFLPCEEFLLRLVPN